VEDVRKFVSHWCKGYNLVHTLILTVNMGLYVTNFRSHGYKLVHSLSSTISYRDHD